MKVLNCGYIYWVALDAEVYISGDMYMESILVYYFNDVFYLGFRVAMKFYAGTLTTHRCRSTSYRHSRERVYATRYSART
jgi:hypothetical protein